MAQQATNLHLSVLLPTQQQAISFLSFILLHRMHAAGCCIASGDPGAAAPQSCFHTTQRPSPIEGLQQLACPAARPRHTSPPPAVRRRERVPEQPDEQELREADHAEPLSESTTPSPRWNAVVRADTAITSSRKERRSPAGRGAKPLPPWSTRSPRPRGGLHRAEQRPAPPATTTIPSRRPPRAQAIGQRAEHRCPQLVRGKAKTDRDADADAGNVAAPTMTPSTLTPLRAHAVCTEPEPDDEPRPGRRRTTPRRDVATTSRSTAPSGTPSRAPRRAGVGAGRRAATDGGNCGTGDDAAAGAATVPTASPNQHLDAYLSETDPLPSENQGRRCREPSKTRELLSMHADQPSAATGNGHDAATTLPSPSPETFPMSPEPDPPHLVG